MARQFLRFKDLQELGVVQNRPTLQRWIDVEGFPPGRMLGRNTRAWTSVEIEEWVASRPTAVPGRAPPPLLRKERDDVSRGKETERWRGGA